MKVLIFRIDGAKINILNEFINTSLHIFIPYTIIFVIFYLIHILDNKLKVKKLNNELK